jgi:hypothetical protein
MNDLSEKLGRLGKDYIKGIGELERRVTEDREELETMVALPLSVYFDAYRKLCHDSYPNTECSSQFRSQSNSSLL